MRQARITTGDVIGGAFVITTIHQGRYVLCQSLRGNPQHTYAVMEIDADGNLFNSRYFGKSEDAEQFFAALCFSSWMVGMIKASRTA